MIKRPESRRERQARCHDCGGWAEDAPESACGRKLCDECQIWHNGVLPGGAAPCGPCHEAAQTADGPLRRRC